MTRPSKTGRIKFTVLVPVGITVAGRSLPLPAAKMRYLVAILALSHGRTVSVDRLIEVLWNDDPPVSAQKNLHQYIHRLRRLLADHQLADRLVYQPPGYLLRLYPDELDLDCFSTLYAAGRRAQDRGDLPTAARSLTKALALWPGDALADVRLSLVLDEIAQTLAEQRMRVVEERMVIDLQLGRHAHLVCQLASLVAEHPLRERFREFQMLALYASGRRAEALAVYQDYRSALARELGIDPGPSMAELLSAMLANNDALLTSRVRCDQGGSQFTPARPHALYGHRLRQRIVGRVR